MRSAAYNARDAIEAERTGELFYFRHRDAPEHHEVLLPEGASERFLDCAVLWNTAEAAERRKDAQVAREIVLALPSNGELSTEDRIALACEFAQTHFVSKGLAVQLDVHAPHETGEGDESERANWHAHLLITTRRVEGEGFAAKKARDLDPVVRQAGTRAYVTDAEAWGELWRGHQERYFQEHGYDIGVDPTAPHAGEHIGPVRMRKAGSAAGERAQTLRTANEDAARDPGQVLAALTRNNATFTERDLDRFLRKHLAPEEITGTKAAVLGHADVLLLHERETGETAGRFTTRQVRAQEEAALADARMVAAARHHRGVSTRSVNAATTSRSLRPDQRAAFDHATAADGGLTIIEGRAGTGKSYTLAAVREAHERDGHRVVGLAPTNAVAQDLKADGFSEAGTAHAELFRLKNGRTAWDSRTVVIIDEAAMLDSRVTGELLAEARASGAKVILAGDDRQLASIERGGLFTELRQRHGSAEISEVTRQRVDWQRQAARDLAEGRFGEAVAAYDRAGAITWTADQDGARAALVAAWTRDSLAEPDATRFVFAYTNRDVDTLNAELRQVRRDRGELGSPDVALETKHGVAAFAIGDRVQFTDTDKRARIYNGNVGTITGLDAHTGEMRAVLDGAGGEGREVAWSAAEFQGFRHGYAGTIYKGQGKTLDHTYLYHTEHWRAAASYVALTRQRESAQVFVARETAHDVHQLARQMARGEVKAASVAWATADELPVGLRSRVEPQETGPEHPEQRQERTTADAEQPKPSSRPEARQEAAEEWLLTPFVRPDGRDSLGRGLDAASVAAAVAGDQAAQRERKSLENYLRGTYRDPDLAKERLDELIERDGWTSAASRVLHNPEQLGELRGRVGLLAGAGAKAERANAERASQAIAPCLERIVAAEGRAERGYRTSVEAQLQADATPVPRLSEAAAQVLTALHAATEDKQAAETWRVAMGDPVVGAELQRFRAAVRQRFGEDGARDLYRMGKAGIAASHPSVPKTEQDRLDQVGRITAVLVRAELRHAEVQRQSEQASQRAGPRMRM